MAETHVLSALKEKRARVAGELEQAKLRVVALTSDLASIDACLQIFRSDVPGELIPAKVSFCKNPVGLPKGVSTRTALEILRETGEAMSTPEIAACILQRYGKPLEAKGPAGLKGPAPRKVENGRTKFARRLLRCAVYRRISSRLFGRADRLWICSQSCSGDKPTGAIHGIEL